MDIHLWSWPQEKGNRDVAQLILANGADVKKRTNKKYTALMAASSSGLKEIIGKLIAKGADINMKSASGRTPLFFAVESDNQIDVVDLLLKNGAKIDVANGSGRRAYHYAFLNEHDELGKFLISKGAKIDKDSRLVDDCYTTVQAYMAKGLLLENEGNTLQALEHYQIAEEYCDKASPRYMKLSDSYATSQTKGTGASILSSLAGILGSAVDRKNLQSGKQTNWRDLAPDVKVEKIAANKKLQAKYAAKAGTCDQLSIECNEHIKRLKKTGS